MNLTSMRDDALSLLGTLDDGALFGTCREYAEVLQMALLGKSPFWETREDIARIVETCGKRRMKQDLPLVKRRRVAREVRTYDKFLGEEGARWKSYAKTIKMEDCKKNFQNIYRSMRIISGGAAFDRAAERSASWKNEGRRNFANVVAMLRGHSWLPALEKKVPIAERACESGESDIGFHMSYDELPPDDAVLCAYAILLVDDDRRSVEIYWMDADPNVMRWWGGREVTDRIIYKVCSQYVDYDVTLRSKRAGQETRDEWGFEVLPGKGERLLKLSAKRRSEAYSKKIRSMQRKGTKIFQYDRIGEITGSTADLELTWRVFARDPDSETISIDKDGMSDIMSLRAVAHETLQTRDSSEVVDVLSTDVVILLYLRVADVLPRKERILRTLNRATLKLDRELEVLRKIEMTMMERSQAIAKQSDRLREINEQCMESVNRIIDIRRRLHLPGNSMEEILRLKKLDLSMSGWAEKYCADVKERGAILEEEIASPSELLEDLRRNSESATLAALRAKDLESGARMETEQPLNAIGAINDGAMAAVSCICVKMLEEDYVYVKSVSVDSILPSMNIKGVREKTMEIARSVPTESGARGVLLYALPRYAGFYEKIGMAKKEQDDFDSKITLFLQNNECLCMGTPDKEMLTCPIYESAPLSSEEEKKRAVRMWSGAIREMGKHRPSEAEYLEYHLNWDYIIGEEDGE